MMQNSNIVTSRSTSSPLTTPAAKPRKSRRKPAVSNAKVHLFHHRHTNCLTWRRGAVSLSAILELTHNHGTETLEKTPYHSGNADSKGFGHIAITVANVEEACARFERLGVPFKKRLTDGKMRHIAFILDPDGYWIEVVCSDFFLGSSPWVKVNDIYARLCHSCSSRTPIPNASKKAYRMARRVNESKFEKPSVFCGSNQIYVCCARLRPGLMAAMSAVCLLQCIDQLTKRLHLI